MTSNIQQSDPTMGRIVGGLLLLQITGFILPFVLLLPLSRTSQLDLAAVAAAASQIKLAVFLLCANGTVTIGITIAAFGVLRARSESMALWLFAAGLVMFVLQAVDSVHVLSLLSLSQQHVRADGSNELASAAASAVSTRRWAHLSEILSIDAWVALFHAGLFRFRLVPRAFAVFGLLTVTSHFAGIPLRSFLGSSPVAAMGMPMALSHVVVAVWLLAKGFQDRRPPQPPA